MFVLLGNHVQIMSAETNLSYFTRVTNWGGGWIPNLPRDTVTGLDFGKSVLSFCADESCVVVQIRGLTHMCLGCGVLCCAVCACNWRGWGLQTTEIIKKSWVGWIR